MTRRQFNTISFQVENVARYLHYANPEAPSLDFVRDTEKLRHYLCDLSKAKLKKRTQLNYLKSLKRLVAYYYDNVGSLVNQPYSVTEAVVRGLHALT